MIPVEKYYFAWPDRWKSINWNKYPLRSSNPSSTKQQRVHTISSVEPTDAWDTYDTFINQNDNSIYIFDPDDESFEHISIVSHTSPTGKFSALIDGGAKILVSKDSSAKQSFRVPSIILKYENETIKSSCWAITIPGFLGNFLITNELSEDIIMSHDFFYLNNFILVYNKTDCMVYKESITPHQFFIKCPFIMSIHLYLIFLSIWF